MDSKTFQDKHSRLLALCAASRGQDEALKKAEEVVRVAKQKADEARVNAIVNPTAEPAAAEAERVLEAALEKRDQLATRGPQLLESAIKRLEDELGLAAAAFLTSVLEAEAKKVRAELLKVKPVIEDALRRSALLWRLEHNGSPPPKDPEYALDAAVGVDFRVLRRAAGSDYKQISAAASAPRHTLAEYKYASMLSNAKRNGSPHARLHRQREE